MTAGIKVAFTAGVALALAGTHWYAFDAGRDVGLAASAIADGARKDGVITLVTDAVVSGQIEQKQNGAKARKVSDDLQKEITGVLDYRAPVASVRLPALAFSGCTGAAGSAEAPNSGRLDGPIAAAAVFPEEVQRAFDQFTAEAGQLAKEADKTAAVARAHQDFARMNGLYGEPEQGADE